MFDLAMILGDGYRAFRRGVLGNPQEPCRIRRSGLPDPLRIAYLGKSARENTSHR